MTDPPPELDEIQPGSLGVGYRVVLDLSEEDADVIDRVARREGLQPTQILLEALRAYAGHETAQSAQARAIARFADALRAAAEPEPVSVPDDRHRMTNEA